MSLEIIINDQKNYKLLDHSNKLKMCIDQIQMLLFTSPGDILGYPDFGIDLKSYLWENQFAAEGMKKYIDNQINKYVLFKNIFDIQTEVRLIRGEYQDSAFIDISINGEQMIGVHVN